MSVAYIEKAQNGIIINHEHESSSNVYEIHNKHITECLSYIKENLKLQGIEYLKNELKYNLLFCKFIYETIHDLEYRRSWNTLPTIDYIILEKDEIIPEDAFLYG